MQASYLNPFISNPTAYVLLKPNQTNNENILLDANLPTKKLVKKL